MASTAARLALPLAVVALVACSSSTQDSAASAPTVEVNADMAAEPSTPPASTVATEGARARPAPANAEALDFEAPRLGGGTVRGIDHAGEDVVLWMWAPWCPQCNREAPHVREAVDRFGDEVTFIGIPGHDSVEAHQAFVDEHDLNDIAHAVDDDQASLWSRYGVSYQPAWVFIDDGGDVEVVAGGLYDGLEARVQDLVDR